jgi:hypothetical protein
VAVHRLNRPDLFNNAGKHQPSRRT